MITSKHTKLGQDLSSSEISDIVLGETAFGSCHKVYDQHLMALKDVEVMSERRTTPAMIRGLFLERSVADWFYYLLCQEIHHSLNITVEMLDPQDASRPQDYNPDLAKYGLGASVDRILVCSEDLTLSVAGFTFHLKKGKNILEIKTDYYHTGKCKPEWQIQVQHQMICTGTQCGIIVCKDQTGKLNIYQSNINEKMCKLIMKKAEDFWRRIEEEDPYPPIIKEEDQGLRSKTLDETILKKTNQDVVQLTEDYLVASVEERKWKKTKDKLKEDLSDVLDSLNLDVLTIPGQFQIKSHYSKVEKYTIEKKPTGVMREQHSFTVKEIKDE